MFPTQNTHFGTAFTELPSPWKESLNEEGKNSLPLQSRLTRETFHNASYKDRLMCRLQGPFGSVEGSKKP